MGGSKGGDVLGDPPGDTLERQIHRNREQTGKDVPPDNSVPPEAEVGESWPKTNSRQKFKTSRKITQSKKGWSSSSDRESA
jgi:hypothetical protein